MPSTYSKLHYHIVFATKNRLPLISTAWTSDLHAYIGGCIKQAGGTPLEIGGFRDHIHILTGLKPTHRVCDVLCDIKSASSKWVHDHIQISNFQWQEGYAAFSASAKEVRELREYILGQEEHHRNITFLEEYENLLKESGMELDHRYLP